MAVQVTIDSTPVEFLRLVDGTMHYLLSFRGRSIRLLEWNLTYNKSTLGPLTS